MNYYRRFPGDYLRDTLHLTMTQDGAYTRLLDAYYSAEKPLPKDRKILYTMVRANTKQDRAAVEFILSQFFLNTRHGFINRRAKKEFLRAKEISVKRANAGKQRAKLAANAGHLLRKPEARLQTPDSRLQIEHKSGGGAAAAFGALGFDKPFGQVKFQAIWVKHFEIATAAGEWLTRAMEGTAQECQALSIGVPPQFFSAKRDVEAREMAEFERKYHRTPL